VLCWEVVGLLVFWVFFRCNCGVVCKFCSWGCRGGVVGLVPVVCYGDFGTGWENFGPAFVCFWCMGCGFCWSFDGLSGRFVPDWVVFSSVLICLVVLL